MLLKVKHHNELFLELKQQLLVTLLRLLVDEVSTIREEAARVCCEMLPPTTETSALIYYSPTFTFQRILRLFAQSDYHDHILSRLKNAFLFNDDSDASSDKLFDKVELNTYVEEFELAPNDQWDFVFELVKSQAFLFNLKI